MQQRHRTRRSPANCGTHPKTARQQAWVRPRPTTPGPSFCPRQQGRSPHPGPRRRPARIRRRGRPATSPARRSAPETWAVQARISEVWRCGAPVVPPQRTHDGGCLRVCEAGAGAGDWQVAVGESDTAGLSGTSWDMIQNLHRADQAHSEATDATRTDRGFHGARDGEMAGQRAFRWVGMGSL
jgi:hypothetical protein